MQLTLLGGAGVRVPLMVEGLLKRHDDVRLDRLVLYDTDKEKLHTIAALVRHLANRRGSPFEIKVAEDLREAVRGADFIYTAIRVGGERGRAVDERVALRHNVLGQETTGPGGFAMALRTIPQMLAIANIVEEEAPEAWLVNFTNPSGLITEALQKYTSVKAIGICDAPSAMKLEVAAYLNVPEEEVFIRYTGLNHLGWIDQIKAGGRDHLHSIIGDYDNFIKKSSHIGHFSKSLVKSLNALPNEYLYYFYYREKAVHNILESSQTRGEQIVSLNDMLLRQLDEALADNDGEEALNRYEQVMKDRDNSYMSSETNSQAADMTGSVLESEGYEGLAMSIITSIQHNQKRTLVLNVPNNGVLQDLEDDDVIEVTCLLDSNGPVPIGSASVPQSARGLLKSVKEYERLTVEAAVEGNREKAVMALTVHPLVMSYSLATALVDDYLQAHSEWLPTFCPEAAE